VPSSYARSPADTVRGAAAAPRAARPGEEGHNGDRDPRTRHDRSLAPARTPGRATPRVLLGSHVHSVCGAVERQAFVVRVTLSASAAQRRVQGRSAAAGSVTGWRPVEIRHVLRQGPDVDGSDGRAAGHFAHVTRIPDADRCAVGVGGAGLIVFCRLDLGTARVLIDGAADCVRDGGEAALGRSAGTDVCAKPHPTHALPARGDAGGRARGSGIARSRGVGAGVARLPAGVRGAWTLEVRLPIPRAGRLEAARPA